MNNFFFLNCHTFRLDYQDTQMKQTFSLTPVSNGRIERLYYTEYAQVNIA